MRYFGATAEDATIQVLTLIDWAAEYVKMRSCPVPDILRFLQSPFVTGGRPAQNPMPTDPGASLRQDIDVCTKAQLTWTYLCALLQIWTDEATVAEDGMYGGKRRLANPLVSRIRAVINPFAGKQFEVSWESIEASTSWTRARWYFGPPEKMHFESEAAPSPDIRNHLENAMEERWKKMMEGPARGKCDGVCFAKLGRSCQSSVAANWCTRTPAPYSRGQCSPGFHTVVMEDPGGAGSYPEV